MTAVRLSADQIDQWRREGGLLLEGFFDAEAIARVRRDFAVVYALDPEAALSARETTGDAAKEGAFHSDQLQAIRSLPAFTAPRLNLLALDTDLLGVVRALLDGDVTLYRVLSV